MLILPFALLATLIIELTVRLKLPVVLALKGKLTVLLCQLFGLHGAIVNTDILKLCIQPHVYLDIFDEATSFISIELAPAALPFILLKSSLCLTDSVVIPMFDDEAGAGTCHKNRK